MGDFYEIDFLNIDSGKSGDAIPLQYELAGKTYTHVVDGGFQGTGQQIIQHIQKYYSNDYVDFVVATHPDGDHAGGLRAVLEELQVGELWMLRPWLYADEIIDRFSRFTSVDNLKKRLKEIYPNIAALEEIAIDKNISIRDPFQGQIIGAFTVLAPTKERYLDLIVESDKSPEQVPDDKSGSAEGAILEALFKGAAKVVAFIRSAWGEEVFSPEETSSENEMSVIQYAYLCEMKILLTGDAGRSALNEAANYAPFAGLQLPGIHRFQVPHHGSRRNVSTETLDRWLGEIRSSPPEEGKELFEAFVSASKKDKDHPRKAVIRAMEHRGGKVYTTQGTTLCTSKNAKNRDGWSAAKPLEYPDEQEE